MNRTNHILTIQKEDGIYNVYFSGRQFGAVELYDNPFHKKNCYVKLNIKQFDSEIGSALFRQLREIAGRPLQIMVSSQDTALTDFLNASGFQRKRRCYEVEGSKKDFIGGNVEMPLEQFASGDAEYGIACQLLFHYYLRSHEAINPWTADYETFCTDLPKTVICAKINGKIASLAFVEDNEIAYVCGADKDHFFKFAHSLVITMLMKYKTICFESDDCDWAAMLLKSLFANQADISFDTYLYVS